MSCRCGLFAVLRSWSDDRLTVRDAFKMLAAGMSVRNPFIQKILRQLVKEDLSQYHRCRIPLAGSYMLKGCPDSTSLLQRNQVAIVLWVSS